MKRYVRLKDNKICEVYYDKKHKLYVIKQLGLAFHKIENNKLYWNGKLVGEIVAESDNIEDLFDEIIIRRTPIDDKNMVKYLNRKAKTAYGAMWTDKGLIYVAKLNDKGEWKVL